MNTIGILGLFCGLTVAFALFLSTYFLFLRKEHKLSAMLLGVVFLAVSLRISKSIWFFIFYDVAPVGLMMGYTGLSIIGPAVYLYVRNTVQNVGLKAFDGLHLIIPLTGMLISLFSDIQIVTIAYKTTTLVMAIYLAFAWRKHSKVNYDSEKLKNWNRHVLTAVSAVWISFVYQHLTETLFDYAIGGGLASIPIYYLSIAS